MSKAFKSVGKAATGAVSLFTGASTLSKLTGGSSNPIGDAFGLSGQGQQQIMGLPDKLSVEGQRIARMRDIGTGREFARSVIPQGSLGRLGNITAVQQSMDTLRLQQGGFTAPEMQAQRDILGQGIARQTQMTGRQLAAAQARAGVRGATAAAQQGEVLSRGIQAGANMERDLMLRSRAEETRAAQAQLEAAERINRFDLSQAARERMAELGTGLGFAQIGSAERAGVTAGNAAVAAAQAQKPSGGLLGGVLGK